jgi:hypothetical protein
MKPAVASIVARLAGREMATVPTDMTILTNPAAQILVMPNSVPDDVREPPGLTGDTVTLEQK